MELNQLPNKSLSDNEFYLFQQLILNELGIFLPLQKKALLTNRLWKRLLVCQLDSYKQYYQFIVSARGTSELHAALELITTNETYFFREQKHFDFLMENILPKYGVNDELRIWSAAASTGEEPYSIAMILADRCLARWELLCSDVNYSVVEQAKLGIYPEVRARNISEHYLRRFCRKGVGPREGYIRVVPELRERVNFFTLNLNRDFSDIGKFDVIFLRNVLIYFENETKAAVLERVASVLKPNGILFVGHSESLHGVSQGFTSIRPAIYRLT